VKNKAAVKNSGKKLLPFKACKPGSKGRKEKSTGQEPKVEFMALVGTKFESLRRFWGQGSNVAIHRALPGGVIPGKTGKKAPLFGQEARAEKTGKGLGLKAKSDETKSPSSGPGKFARKAPLQAENVQRRPSLLVKELTLLSAKAKVAAASETSGRKERLTRGVFPEREHLESPEQTLISKKEDSREGAGPGQMHAVVGKSQTQTWDKDVQAKRLAGREKSPHEPFVTRFQSSGPKTNSLAKERELQQPERPYVSSAGNKSENSKPIPESKKAGTFEKVGSRQNKQARQFVNEAKPGYPKPSIGEMRQQSPASKGQSPAVQIRESSPGTLRIIEETLLETTRRLEVEAQSSGVGAAGKDLGRRTNSVPSRQEVLPSSKSPLGAQVQSASERTSTKEGASFVVHGEHRVVLHRRQRPKLVFEGNQTGKPNKAKEQFEVAVKGENSPQKQEHPQHLQLKVEELLAAKPEKQVSRHVVSPSGKPSPEYEVKALQAKQHMELGLPDAKAAEGTPPPSFEPKGGLKRESSDNLLWPSLQKGEQKTSSLETENSKHKAENTPGEKGLVLPVETRPAPVAHNQLKGAEGALVDASQLLEAVQKAAKELAHKNKPAKVEFSLDSHFGTVKVTLSKHDGGLHLQFTAANEHARQALQRGLQDLCGRLEQLGCALSGAEVSTGGEGAFHRSAYESPRPRSRPSKIVVTPEEKFEAEESVFSAVA